MRNIRVLAAALGGVLAINIAACSGTDWGIVAETSHTSETPGSSDASDSPSPPSTVAASASVDIAETKLFKNRPGNAPKRADGTYDYTAPGFKLFDICAELDGEDFAEDGLILSEPVVIENFASVCSIRNQEFSGEWATSVFSTSTESQKAAHTGGQIKSKRGPSGIATVNYIDPMDSNSCVASVSTPGGEIGVGSPILVNATHAEKCDLAVQKFEDIVANVLLGK